MPSNTIRVSPCRCVRGIKGAADGATMKLLCIGDIHLGRRPGRLPQVVLDRIPARELGPSAAWASAVQAAIDAGVGGVLLAGDVVEDNDDFYEAYSDLAGGVRRLVEAGIPVLGVAGNHDVEVLPRLADAIPEFRLLGRRGVWEAQALEGDGAALEVLGWSFPAREVRASPLAGRLPAREHAGVPRIGLLHCDRDQTASPYAPVRSRELEAAEVDAWLLGHVHRPDPLDAQERPIGYLGSLCGLDPGEPGAHGPWLLEAAQGRIVLEQLPLAPLRWETVEVPLDALERPQDAGALIVRAVEALLARLAADPHRPRAVGCRVRLTGRTGRRREIDRGLRAEGPHALVVERGGVIGFVDRWTLEARPALDLDALAAGTDPAARLAHKVIVLRRGRDDPERRALLERARRRFEAVTAKGELAPLRAEAPDEDAAAAMLEHAALAALDALLAQRETVT